MTLRSWLFVPGDSDSKIAKSASTGADVLILDLEDSVALTRKQTARETVSAALRAPRGPAQIYVRINPLGTGMALQDLAAIMQAAPDGIVLPKPDSGADVEKLALYLDAFEAAHNLQQGVTKILPIATETAKSIFTLNTYAHPRLTALTWGAEDLPAAVGVALASAGRRVICLIGDGSMMYSVQALWTAVQHKLPVSVVVINNGGYGAMRAFSEVLQVRKPPGIDLPGLDFVSLAAGMGCAGMRVSRAVELDAALRASFGGAGPHLVEVVVDPATAKLYDPA